MTLSLLFLILFIGSIIGAGFIVVRKFPQLTLIDAESLPQEREARKKKELMKLRVGRKTNEYLKRIIKALAPVAGKIREIFRRQYKKILVMEQRFRQDKKMDAPSVRLKVGRLVAEAEELAEDGKGEKAEKRFIEAISLDPKSLPAYRGLGALYMKSKKYRLAKETISFLVRTSIKEHCRATDHVCEEGDFDPGRHGMEPVVAAEVAADYADLGEVCAARGELKEAKLAYRKAADFEPDNPKYLDLLIETCILEGDSEGASAALWRLKQANPENRKIGAFEKEIAGIAEKQVTKDAPT